jgi:hypothetical protein
MAYYLNLIYRNDPCHTLQYMQIIQAILPAPGRVFLGSTLCIRKINRNKSYNNASRIELEVQLEYLATPKSLSNFAAISMLLHLAITVVHDLLKLCCHVQTSNCLIFNHTVRVKICIPNLMIQTDKASSMKTTQHQSQQY